MSTILTFFMTKWQTHWQLNAFAAIFMVWGAENGGYYLTVWIGDKFSRSEEKLFKEGKESLKQLLAVEGLDTVIRFLLLWLASQMPAHQEMAAAAGSLAADIGFSLALGHSHRLLEIFACSTKAILGYSKVFWNDSGILQLGLQAK